MSKENVLLVVGIIISGLFYLYLYYGVAKPAMRFYKIADALEKDIKENDDKDQQLIKLFELNKKSWHRITGERVTTLAKMMEIKYKIKILK